MDATAVTDLTIPSTDQRAETGVAWHPLTRVAFRFSVVYFSLYVLTTQMLESLSPIPIPAPADSGLIQNAVTRVATRLFHFPAPLVIISGSGDKPFDWVLAFCTLIAAALATIVWSLLDARRLSYLGAHRWFRLFLRFSLGATLLTYGAIKVLPNQMPFPFLSRLLEPYGSFSLMGVLWAQMGASPAYQTFTGVVESTAAILLFIPGLTLLGALLAFVAMTQVFIVNMTYDVPVKLFSFHLVIMSLVLLAPDLRRLANVLLLNRAVAPSAEPPLFRSRMGQRLAVATQLLFASALVWSNVSQSWQAYSTRGPNAPKPPLYGIWDVETMSIDGVTLAPLTTDNVRWRRVIVQSATAITVQGMDDTFTGFPAKVDAEAGTITLTTRVPSPANPTRSSQEGVAGRLAFRRLSDEKLLLDGDLNGKNFRMELRDYDRSNFRLVQNGFHWVQDYPVNR